MGWVYLSVYIVRRGDGLEGARPGHVTGVAEEVGVQVEAL